MRMTYRAEEWGSISEVPSTEMVARRGSSFHNVQKLFLYYVTKRFFGYPGKDYC